VLILIACGTPYAVTRTQTAVEGYDPINGCEDMGSFDVYVKGAAQTVPTGVDTKVGSGRIQQERITVDGLNWMAASGIRNAICRAASMLSPPTVAFAA
jgi:hypothetical protein